MAFFNRKNPKVYEDEAEAWMQKARRVIQCEILCYFTFQLVMRVTEKKTVIVNLIFLTSTASFETSLKKDPEKFVRKEIIPWIRKNGQHV